MSHEISEFAVYEKTFLLQKILRQLTYNFFPCDSAAAFLASYAATSSITNIKHQINIAQEELVFL